VIEETPAPGITDDLRMRLGETAVRAAQTVNYSNAGTVEFLVDTENNFYFLEMNTRLQVEHPITEMVTGIDIVEWQIRVAAGEPLPLTQAKVQRQGHAIEARIYAENPANDFLPETGPILHWQAPTGAGVRVDAGVQTGSVVSIHYDPMLAKVIAHGDDRATAVRRLIQALANCTLLGFRHNIAYLQAVVRQPAFAAGHVSTDFLETHFADWQMEVGDVALALTAVTLIQFQQQPQHPTNAGYWRNNPTQPLLYLYRLGDEEFEVKLYPIAHQPNRFPGR
jgi:geranyl-CoA carboxylase alpha subunit